METKEEYHDPDYPETSAKVQDESQTVTEDGKVEKIRSIIRKEFADELGVRENEIMNIDQRLSNTRKMLHRLRYTLVNNYYGDEKLQLTNSHIQEEVAAQNDPKTRNEVISILRDGQKRLHPSVRKLLGKKTVDIEEIFKRREPRRRRRDYSAMLKNSNITISADEATKSLRPGLAVEPPQPPIKAPRRRDPKLNNIVTVDDVTRNKTKHRYRIIIGNTSKYSPASSPLDRSTHQWLIYVRGEGANVITNITVRLHHSYQPHHTVHLHKAPFQISRRGWGEFPARLEIHFQQPELNRPAHVDHTIKLDHLHTGLQTLGAETIVDVWLYSTQDMLQYEYQEENDVQNDTINNIQPKIEPMDITPNETDDNTNNLLHNDSWLDFFSKDTTDLDVDEMIIKPIKNINPLNTIIKNEITEDTEIQIKLELEEEYEVENEVMLNEIKTETAPKTKIMKYIDPNTGKIYYLEMDRDLDLSSVQEISINSDDNAPTEKNNIPKQNVNGKNVKKHKNDVIISKTEINNVVKEKVNESPKVNTVISHIENDHCYIEQNWLSKWMENTKRDVQIEKKPKSNEILDKVPLYENLVSVMPRFTNSRVAVSYLLKKIPLISKEARDTNFVKNFPFVVENDEFYWKLNFAKRRNIEWSRAKLINKLLHTHLESDQIWRTKQILAYSRFHGYYPVRPEATEMPTNDDWSIYNEKTNPINKTLTIFDKEKYTNNLSDTIDLSDSDDEIEIVGDPVIKVEKEIKDEEKNLDVLPVCESERLNFMYIETKCADIGVELRNEDIGNGYSYSAVHAVLLSAMKSHMECLIRSALANKLKEESRTNTVWVGSSSSLPLIKLHHLTDIEPATTDCDLGTLHTQTYNI